MPNPMMCVHGFPLGCCAGCSLGVLPGNPGSDWTERDANERTVQEWHDDAMRYADDLLKAKKAGQNLAAPLIALLAFNCELAALRRAGDLNVSLATRTILRRSLVALAEDAFTFDRLPSGTGSATDAQFDAEIAELEASAPPTPADLPADFDASVLYDECDACNGSGMTGPNQRCQWCNPVRLSRPDGGTATNQEK